MKKTYIKLMARGIRKSITRFLSIFAIVALGVGFLAGLLATTPDMRMTADKYFDDSNMADIEIKSALGLTDEDIDALKNQDCVENAVGMFVCDTVLDTGTGSMTARIYGFDGGPTNNIDMINRFELIEGRLPESGSECLIACPNSYRNSLELETTLTLSGDQSTDILSFDSLTPVGIITLPTYMSVESEPTNAGGGTVELIIYADSGIFDIEGYVGAFVTIKGARELDTFESDYKSLISDAKDELGELAKDRETARYNGIVNDALEQIEKSRQELNEKKQQANDSLSELSSGIDSLNNSLNSLKSAPETAQTKAAAEEMTAKLGQLTKQYEQAKKKLDEEVVAAEEQIAQAKLDIQEISKAEWYITDRSSTVSFSSFESNSEKINAIAKVFPVFFFFVAALVALTTMTRMVEEERSQIGTLKSLGYSNGAISLYYIGYSVLASLTGSAVGIVLGLKTLPTVIGNAYTMLYRLPKIITRFDLKYALIIIPIAIGTTTLATLFSCINELREKPCTLYGERAPKVGKRIFLERISFIWKHMKFSHKVTARNIFRYKKRLFMTVFGITGCTALLLTGFGLNDSINDICDKQFGELYKYNLSINLKNDFHSTADEVTDGFLKSDDTDSYAVCLRRSVTAESGDEQEKATLISPDSAEDFRREVVLRNRKSGKEVGFDGGTVLMSEKLAGILSLEPGDSFTLTDGDGKSAELTLSDIFEGYISGYIYIGSDAYRQAFGAPEYNHLLVTVRDDSEETRARISKTVLESDNVALAQFSATIRESFENTVKSINYIVAVLIAAAGALAVIVLYNLTNINICERKKELGTLKVLGFHGSEVAGYIYRETTILCIIGILAGFIFGKWLHSFVIHTAEVGAVMFGRSIYPLSYILAAFVTAFFAGLVDLIMLRKLKNIDMVEATKAND
ncbi:MAG: FtsX-like permease family protein [Firmicutes bacterium]|nr:FtsX-like permease family protein [Bacillota bacterium]